MYYIKPRGLFLLGYRTKANGKGGGGFGYTGNLKNPILSVGDKVNDIFFPRKINIVKSLN